MKEVIQIKLIEQSLSKIKGVLVHGPAGIGKTLAVATVLEYAKESLLASDGSHLIVERLTPADLV